MEKEEALSGLNEGAGSEKGNLGGRKGNLLNTWGWVLHVGPQELNWEVKGQGHTQSGWEL